MSNTTYRSTFSFDALTAKRLRNLAAYWRVSQAEVVRRSIEQAEQALHSDRGDPVDLLERIHREGLGLDSQEADSRLDEIRNAREMWRCG